MKSSRWLWVGMAAMTVAVVGLTIALGVVLTADDESPATASEEYVPPSPVEAALNRCDAVGKGAATVAAADDGHTIIIDTKAAHPETFEGANCVLDALETSEAIRSRVSATTAMQGSQTADQDGITYTWSYHPKNGLNMTITDQ